MRFAFVSTMLGAPWGGSEELWSQTAIQLRRAGHDVRAFVGYWPRLSDRVTELIANGVRVETYPSYHSGRARSAWDRFSRSGRRRHQQLMQFGGDFVVISLGHISEGFDWARVCRQAKIPYAMLLHCNSDTWWFTDQEVDEAVASYTAARRVFCVSRQNLELLDIQLGTPLENGDIVWNPHNVAIDTDLEWPEDNPTLGLACIGRLNPEPKGQDLLMRIMSRPEWRERPVELNLYGAGPYEQSLRRICQLLELTNVHFRGHVNDVRTIWSRNHILVQSSRYEGVPMTVSEAMWCGRPAVVTNVGRCGELCVDGVTGFVAQEATVSSFGQALERAWERRSEWRNMGLAARTRADTFVPKNPVALFCDQLKACAAEEVLSASPELAIPAKPQKVLD